MLLTLALLDPRAAAHGLTFIGVISLDPADPVPGAERRLLLAVEDPAGNPVPAEQVAVAFGEAAAPTWQPLAVEGEGRYGAPVRLPATAGWHTLQVNLQVAGSEWRSRVSLQVGADASPVEGKAFGLEHQEEQQRPASWYLGALGLLLAITGWLIWMLLRKPKPS